VYTISFYCRNVNFPKDMLLVHHIELLWSLNYQEPENDPNFLKMLVFPNCATVSSLLLLKWPSISIFRIDSDIVHHALCAHN